ncbi:MAG TPA: ABC transporter ATP-binding protein [Acidimicrobiales bacterium]|nr:ABC transporter ATP-binding protein [Acidimicrobiales bacterium]
MTEEASEAVLSVSNLEVDFATDAGLVKAVDGVTWSVRRGETLGIVGESGSGKTVSALAVMGLLPPAARIRRGAITFRGRELLRLDAAARRAMKGNEIAMVYQDPLTALNPLMKVGHQIAEAIHAHRKVGRAAGQERAVELLAEVGIPQARQRAEEYPHQFSGGMRQRAMIAMALALDPAVLLADEPTTALDVTVQAQIMQLLMRIQQDRGTAIVLITHDLGLVAGHADRVLVMYSGRVAEVGPVGEIFAAPEHAYTLGLLSSLTRLDHRRGARLTTIPGQPPSLISVPPGCPFHPRCDFASETCRVEIPALVSAARSDHLVACHHRDQVVARAVANRAATSLPSDLDRSQEAPVSGPLLEVANLVKWFPISSGAVFPRHRGDVRAVDGVSLTLGKGETVAVVGESGSGKSTLARTILRLVEPTAGTIWFDGRDITDAGRDDLRHVRREMQIVFQDPSASLNPRMTVRTIVSQPSRIHGVAGEDVGVLLARVGLGPEYQARYPHELSGGQRQRVGIARAIALGPKLIVCDEPVSSLDVSIQSQVLNLLEDLRDQLGLAYLFISHDLSVVGHIAHRVAVMYLGTVVELADRDDLFERPAHPYTQALISAVPIPDPEIERNRPRILPTGDVPSAADPPSGCRFRTRCPKAAYELTESERQQCRDERPDLVDRGQGHPVACHFAAARETL